MIDDSKPPMIKPVAIFLIESNFIRYPVVSSEILPSINLSYEHNINENTGQGFLTANVACINKDTQEKAFEARIRYIGVFQEDSSNPNMKISEFMRVHAPAHILPYLREFLSSLTLRSNMPAIILPPINVAEMVKVKIEGNVTSQM